MQLEQLTEFERFLSVTAVAAILGISRPTVHALVRRGEIPGIWVGQIVRIPATGFETYLRTRGLTREQIYPGAGSPATANPPQEGPAPTAERRNAGVITRCP